MEQIQRYKVMLHTKKSNPWKGYLLNALLAIMAMVPLTLIIFTLQLHTRITTILLIYLFIVLWLVHQRGFWTAVLAAFIACGSFDFFLLQPAFSFSIADFDEGLDLFVFLLFAIILGYFYSNLQTVKLKEHAANLLYEERLRKQSEEVTRQDYEVDIFYNAVQAIRDAKDIKYQLGFITQTIEEAFSYCGVRSCVILVPDLNGKPTIQRLPTQTNALTALTPDEIGSVMWVMEHGKSVRLPNVPLIARTKNSYLRRVVASSTSNEPIERGYSYIVPLLSGQQVLGVLRLLVEDTAHPRLVIIKSTLEMECATSGIHSELFARLRDYALLLIKQALIERALMQEECMRQELSRRTEELQTAFISSVSHDLRTPLAAIKVAASNLLDEAMLYTDTEYGHAVETIIDEADWLSRIVTRMLDLSRIEKGALKLEKELYPIDEILLTTLESGHMRSLLQNRLIKKNISEELPPVEIDPILIGQVLANLVENAIRYTPATSAIEISVQANRELMQISVADRGPGIPPLDRERIFEKFYRVKQEIDDNKGSVAMPQGTGLGLAVCQGFVAAHGGHIWVQNRDGGGAIFQFTLPLRQAEERTNEKNTRC